MAVVATQRATEATPDFAISAVDERGQDLKIGGQSIMDRQPGPGQRGPGTFEWTGGTGKYKEIKGSNTFVGVTQVNWPDGTATGYATWNR
jgi:CubicO group peptidase (beta-lactamase class C family)